MRVGGALPSSTHWPTGGSHSLIAQNGPINDHTAETDAFTSALREIVTARAGAVAELSSTMPNAAALAAVSFGANGILVIVIAFSCPGLMPKAPAASARDVWEPEFERLKSAWPEVARGTTGL